MSRPKGILLAVIGLGLLTGTAHAQTVDQLKRELAAKKAEIAKLESRVRTLEQRSRLNLNNSAAARPVAAVASGPAAPVAPPSAVPPPPTPDDDEMDRALERTLVREGALVLAPYTYELTPQFSAAHWDKVQDPFLRNSYAAAMSFRVGLPWQSQFTFTLPYVHNEFANGSSSGLGDVGFLFSKELMVESDAAPNLVGSIGWTSPTNRGGTFGPIPYVSGFQAGVTAAKRFDPLVVFASVSYFSAASREIAGTKFTPSDVVGLRTGGSLAISPATSVTAGVSVAYLTNAHAIDFVVPNSDRFLSSVDVGFSTIVWRRTLLNVTAQFGLTGHVPDVRLITSLPVRF
jgi:hypothetical protein